MAILLAGDRGARMRQSMWGGSFVVGTDQRGHFIHPSPTAGGIERRLLELLAQVTLPPLAHQPSHSAAARRDLLQTRTDAGAGPECAPTPPSLAAAAAEAGGALPPFFVR